MKLKNLKGTGEWFESLGYPFPFFNVFLAGTTEMAGVTLLILGLGTRIIALPLQIIMLVAIFTLHFDNGFNAGNNGYEIPLYYLLMLLVLIAHGAGKYSRNYLFKNTRLTKYLIGHSSVKHLLYLIILIYDNQYTGQ